MGLGEDLLIPLLQARMKRRVGGLLKASNLVVDMREMPLCSAIELFISSYSIRYSLSHSCYILSPPRDAMPFHPFSVHVTLLHWDLVSPFMYRGVLRLWLGRDFLV